MGQPWLLDSSRPAAKWRGFDRRRSILAGRNSVSPVGGAAARDRRAHRCRRAATIHSPRRQRNRAGSWVSKQPWMRRRLTAQLEPVRKQRYQCLFSYRLLWPVERRTTSPLFIDRALRHSPRDDEGARLQACLSTVAPAGICYGRSSNARERRGPMRSAPKWRRSVVSTR